MTIIKYGSDEEDIVRRLLAALVSQWDELPPAVQDLLLRKACLGFKPASATTSLREKIKVFIQEHGAATGRMRNSPRVPGTRDLRLTEPGGMSYASILSITARACSPLIFGE